MTKGIDIEISDFLGSFSIDDATAEKIERLEDYIKEANTVANMKTGETAVVDAIYDEMMDLLKQVNPDSDLLTELWETGDSSNIEGNQYTELLVKNPMKSIQTIKSLEGKEMQDFLRMYPNSANLHFSLKINGWGTRLVYVDREFVSATSRARASAGKDLTNQLRVVLEKNNLLTLPASAPDGMIEFRGELALPFSNMDRAREFNPSIVSAFSGVSSMARESASEDENRLLDFIAYKVISDDLSFDTQQGHYKYLSSDLGFIVPDYFWVTEVKKEELVEVLEDTVSEIAEQVFAEDNGYDYFTDGVVVQLDSYNDFYAMGDGEKFDFGNIALKVGHWRQDNYFGYVQYVEYTKGKQKLSPVAIVSNHPNDVIFEVDGEEYSGLNDLHESFEEGIDNLNFRISDSVTNFKDLGVGTASGNRVRRVPLYEVGNLIRLDVKPNSILHFKYGGESGVVPCFEDGSLLKDVKSVEDFASTLFDIDDIEEEYE